MHPNLHSSRPLGRFLCVLLSFTMATGPSAAVFAQTNAAAQAVRRRAEAFDRSSAPSAAPPSRTTRDGRSAPPEIPGTGGIDTSYVSSNAVAVIAVRPAQLMAAPAVQMFPVEVASAAGVKYLGFDPADIEEVIAFAEMPAGETPPNYAVAIKFAKPFSGRAIPSDLRAHTHVGDLAGRKYLQSGDPVRPSLYAPDSTTLVAAPDATLRQLVAQTEQPKTGPVVDRVHAAPAGSDLYVAVDVTALRPLMAVGLMQAAQKMPPNAPPEVQQLFEAPNLISAAEFTFDASSSGNTSLVVHANDDASAERLAQLVDLATQLYQSQLKTQIAQAQPDSDDPIAQAMNRYMERMSTQWAAAIRPQRDGAQLTFFKSDGSNRSQQQFTQVAVIGILVALLLPAIQAAREAARRNVAMSQMKQIMLALLNYHDQKRTFPAHAIYSRDGQPLLSWRVQILPYLEGGPELYKQFKLDEPWDSEHNRALIPLMPAVYANPKISAEPGKTNYLAVVGDACGFNGTPQGLGLRDFADGTSNTIILVEADADRAVEWTKPDDWQFDPNNLMAGLGHLRPGGWYAAFADASVRRIDNGIDQQSLSALFTRAGGDGVPQSRPDQFQGQPRGEQQAPTERPVRERVRGNNIYDRQPDSSARPAERPVRERVRGNNVYDQQPNSSRRERPSR